MKLRTTALPSSDAFRQNREAHLGMLDTVRQAADASIRGGGPEAVAADGVHPTPLGHDLLQRFDAITRRVDGVSVERERAAQRLADRPVVVDFVVERDAMVWPMVPAGVSNDAIQIARDAAPQWDREESEAIEQSTDADHDGQ